MEFRELLSPEACLGEVGHLINFSQSGGLGVEALLIERL